MVGKEPIDFSTHYSTCFVAKAVPLHGTSAALVCRLETYAFVCTKHRPDDQKRSCSLMNMSHLTYCPIKCVMQLDGSSCWRKGLPENRDRRWEWKSVDLWLACSNLVTLSTTLLFSFFVLLLDFFVMLPKKHSTSWGINQSMVLLVTLRTGMKKWSKHPLSGWGLAKSSSFLPDGWHMVGLIAQDKLFSRNYTFQCREALALDSFV